jgi:hypothetical protein
MEQNADTAADDAEQIADSSIPTAGRTIVRTLPAGAVAVTGIPLVGWFLPPDSADGVPWELLTVFAALGLMAVVHHFTKAPRPRFDKTVPRAQWTRAHDAAAKSGFLPSMPGMRIAAGVAACGVIEGCMALFAVFLGALLGQLVRPDLSWLLPVSGAIGVAAVYAFRLRPSWSYLHVLHSNAQAR